MHETERERESESEYVAVIRCVQVKIGLALPEYVGLPEDEALRTMQSIFRQT